MPWQQQPLKWEQQELAAGYEDPVATQAVAPSLAPLIAALPLATLIAAAGLPLVPPVPTAGAAELLAPPTTRPRDRAS